MTYTEKRCCDKCYHDIENGIVFTIFQCEECPCHKAIAQALAEDRERVKKVIDEPLNFDSRTSATLRDEIVKIINHERQRILSSLDKLPDKE